tara:strand:- start:5312 stop:5563 length:252 start_codon:yes stop_codon:yes gene_type:complete
MADHMTNDEAAFPDMIEDEASTLMMMQFSTSEAALRHRNRKGTGGWVFVDDKYSNSWWFSATHYTASTVMTHPVIRGRSGKLY